MRAAEWVRLSIALIPLMPVSAVRGEDELDRPPIEYSTATPDNVVATLQQQIEAGTVRLDYDAEHGRGYLPALLEYLDIPSESQMLVFSRTSLQRQRISPRTPRAIYFNDEAYVGFCQSGTVLEISAADARLGTVFYTLGQKDGERPHIARQGDNCLICHSSTRTGSVPGHLVRSLFADATGEPILSAGSYTVDQTTPLAQRWGGWYVTGRHGDQTHLGNLIVRDGGDPHQLRNDDGQNRTDLSDLVKLDHYLSPHSDIVALMVLEHQTFVHNRLTQANFTARQALDYEAMMNRALGKPDGTRLESTTRRIAGAGDDLVEALLFVDEATLTSPVNGTSGYAESFEQRGPFDGQGRSLREFDIERRMFRYPCSYLIYSRSFDALPPEMREYVWQRLWDVLSGADQSETFAHLTAEDRQAIREIIRDTKAVRPGYWQ
jgi:hypothetical protein